MRWTLDADDDRHRFPWTGPITVLAMMLDHGAGHADLSFTTETGRTMTGAIMGTAAYMSPEQAVMPSGGGPARQLTSFPGKDTSPS